MLRDEAMLQCSSCSFIRLHPQSMSCLLSYSPEPHVSYPSHGMNPLCLPSCLCCGSSLPRATGSWRSRPTCAAAALKFNQII